MMNQNTMLRFGFGFEVESENDQTQHPEFELRTFVILDNGADY